MRTNGGPRLDNGVLSDRQPLPAERDAFCFGVAYGMADLEQPRLKLGFIPIIYYYMKGSAYLHQRPTLGSVLPEQEFAGDNVERID